MLEYLLLLFLMIPFAAVGFSRFPVGDRKYLWGGFFAHAAGALAQWAIIFGYYGGGDGSSYVLHGQLLARMVRSNPEFIVDLLGLAANVRTPAVEWVVGAGTSTGAMSGWAALLGLLVNQSIPAILLSASMFALVGQVGIYIAARGAVASAYRQRLAIACFFVPSVVFWSSGLLKESFALGGLGVVIWAGSRLIRKLFTPKNWLFFLAGAWFLGVFKPYALVPVSVALLVWYFSHQARDSGRILFTRPLYIALGAATSVGAVVLLGSIFPQLEFNAAIEETARLQGAYQRIDAGSTYELGGEEQRTIGQQLVSLPLAIVSALLRPFLFEAHNVVALMNAVETALLLLGIVFIAWRVGPRRVVRYAAQQPFILFAMVFVLLFSAAVGLAAPNLGTLSRYRTLMFPVYVSLVLVLLPMRRPLSQRERA